MSQSSIVASLRGASDRFDPARKAANGLLQNETPWVKSARFTGGIVVAFVVVQALFHMSINNLISGVSLGSLYGLIAVGIILIYRTNRIINFAAVAAGAVPAIFALLLDVQRHISYLVVLPIAVIGGTLFGGLVDILIMRRFARSPRLIATVVTIGVAQGLAALGFFVPIWIGANGRQDLDGAHALENVQWKDAQGTPIITGNQIAAIVVTLAISIGSRCSCATPASASRCARRRRTLIVLRCSEFR